MPESRERSSAGLLAHARDELQRALRPRGPHPELPAPLPAWQRPGASFVTLLERGRLRGCIGSLEARRSLLEDVRENARAAAFRDSRFPPLDERELDDITIEVSVLAPAESFPVTSEEDACARLRPHVDGVVLRYGPHRATFLPQVWQSLPDAHDFLAQLKRKAGLDADFWHPAIELERYLVEKLSEAEEEVRGGS